MLELAFKLFLPIFIIIAFKNPKKAFLIWVLLSPFSTAPVFEIPVDIPDFTFDRIAIGAIILSFFIGSEYKKLFPLKFNKLEKWMIALIFILAIELLFTYRPKDAAARFLTILDMFIIPFLAYYLAKFLLIKQGDFNEDLFKKLVNIAIIAAISIALMGIYEEFTLKDLIPAPESEYSRTHGGGLRLAGGFGRVNGPYFTPETFGVVLSMLFFIVLYKQDIFYEMKGASHLLNRVAHPAVLGTILTAIYFNRFRGIWLGLILGFACRFRLMPKKRLRMVIASIFLLLIIGIIWTEITSSDMYNERIAQSGSFYNRVATWMYCLRAFAQNPFTGIGFGKLPKYIEHAHEAGDIIYFRGLRSVLEAHNTFLCLLAENGILGLIPFLLILWYVIKLMKEYYWAAKKTHNDIQFSVAFISIFIAYFIPLFFDRTGYYNKINNIFYLLAGMMMAKLENLLAQTKIRKNLSV